MKYLIDTCVLSEVARPAPDPRVVGWLDAADESALGISALTIGEIRFGIARLTPGAKRRRLTAWLGELEARFEQRVVPIDAAVARTWAELRARAVAAGSVVPVVDGLVAASAIAHGLVLVTRNVSDVRATGVALLDPWSAPRRP